MQGDIAEEPLTKAILHHLAKTREKDDPLGSFARTVIDGEATLRTSADFPWHSDGLARATEVARTEQENMTSEELRQFTRDADRLREMRTDDLDEGLK